LAVASGALCARTEILIGAEGCERLARARVLVAGVGGVGGHAAEALARAGVGALTLVDHDRVAPSNLNRQIVALQSNLGRAKTAVLGARFRDINPHIHCVAMERFLTPADIPMLNLRQFDAVIDAIDSLASKVALLAGCLDAGVAVFSSMGAGGRLDPGAIGASDLMQTEHCPLARAVRQQLRRRGHGKGVVAVWSRESPRAPRAGALEAGRPVNGTISYIPALFGLHLAGLAIGHLLDVGAAPGADEMKVCDV
jgi:tRNA A37 threonylcarbamoyladenosine dehydratase